MELYVLFLSLHFCFINELVSLGLYSVLLCFFFCKFRFLFHSNEFWFSLKSSKVVHNVTDHISSGFEGILRAYYSY